MDDSGTDGTRDGGEHGRRESLHENDAVLGTVEGNEGAE
jgi:hypothetical protein